MKKIYLLWALALSCWSLQAQSIEDPIMKNNLFLGVKAGVTAMDMAYTKGNTSFVNHSVLYSNPKNILSCSVAGLTVERSLPGFSYGVECLLTGLNAQSPKVSNGQPDYVRQDSAFFLNVRVPLRLKFLNNQRPDQSVAFHPYVFVAPNVSTYLYAPLSQDLVINGYSVWNGEGIKWGRKNTQFLNLSVVGGLGLESDIEVGMYVIRARFEAAYHYGLLNMAPEALGMDRKTRGWEATLGVSFPLFKNPHYAWLN